MWLKNFVLAPVFGEEPLAPVFGEEPFSKENRRESG
jgi:hypothetical protein